MKKISKPAKRLRTAGAMPAMLNTRDAKVKASAALLSGKAIDRATMDAFTNALARTGFGTDNLLEGTSYVNTRLSNNYILMQTLYRSNWIARKLIDCIAEDMFKNWLQMVLDKKPEEIDRFNKAVDDTGTQEKMMTAVKWARLFGGAAALMVIEGHEDILQEPLELEDVELDAYRGLLVFDRWSGISPSANVNNNLNKPEEFGLPASYRITTETGKSFEVHSSRILRFIGRSLPQWEWQATMKWGISEIEVVYDELKKRDNTSWNIASLIFRANILAMKQKDLSQMLSGIGASTAALKQFHSVLQAQTHLMSNQGIMVLPEEGGLENHQYSFGGINDVYVSFMLDICGACEMPMSRLFGRSATGLGQTGEGDEHAYYDMIGQKQKRELQPQLKKLMPVIAMSAWGEVPDDLNWQFNPVRSMTDEQQTELASKQTTAIVETYNAGLLGRKTALKELKGLSETTPLYSNITDEIINEADDEPVGGEMEEMLGGESLKALPGKKEKSLELVKGKGAEKKSGTEDSAMDIVRRTTYQGLPIAIETDAGHVRVGWGWAVTMTHPYGYIEGAAGVDGDALDCFLGPDDTAPFVYVMHVNRKDVPAYDEDKAMLGFSSADQAIAALKENYTPGVTFSMTMLPIEEFRNKLVAPRKITADAARMSKEEVQFESPAEGLDHCSQCIHFEPDTKTCSIVVGEIKPTDWCEEFKSAPKPNGKAGVHATI